MKKPNLSILQHDIPFGAVALGIALIIAAVLIGWGSCQPVPLVMLLHRQVVLASV